MPYGTSGHDTEWLQFDHPGAYPDLSTIADDDPTTAILTSKLCDSFMGSNSFGFMELANELSAIVSYASFV